MKKIRNLSELQLPLEKNYAKMNTLAKVTSTQFPGDDKLKFTINLHKKGRGSMSQKENEANNKVKLAELQKLQSEAKEVAENYPLLKKRVYEEYETDANVNDPDLDAEVAWIISCGFTDYDNYLQSCKTNRQKRIQNKLNNMGFPNPSQN